MPDNLRNIESSTPHFHKTGPGMAATMGVELSYAQFFKVGIYFLPIVSGQNFAFAIAISLSRFGIPY